MIDTTVVVGCDVIIDDDDYCEAEFEVSRTGLPDDLHEVVDRQLHLRGWIGTSRSRVTCPLHVTEGKRRVGVPPTRQRPAADQRAHVAAV